MRLKCENCGSVHELEKVIDLGCQDVEKKECLVCGTVIFEEKVAAIFRLTLVMDATSPPQG